MLGWARWVFLAAAASVDAQLAYQVESVEDQVDPTSFLIDNILDAQSFDNLYSQILFGQIADNNFTISGNRREDSFDDADADDDYYYDYEYADDRIGVAGSCGIVPEGERCEVVSRAGRIRREYKYREGYRAPQYTRPKYKRPAYKDDLRQEQEVISGLVRNGIRNWPQASYLTISFSVFIPFIPFGMADFRLPFIVFINYLVERFNNNYQFDAATGAARRRSFGEDQRDLYDWMDETLSNTLAIDGRTCVKRLICDIADVPIKQRSFIGHIITTIIAPRSGEPGKVADEFVEAELTGHQRGDCHLKYGRCPFSIKALLPKNQL